MRMLFEQPEILGFGIGYLATEGDRITYLGKERPAGAFDRVIPASGMLLTPALYNCHTHLAMTLFRGYGEDLPLQSWLHDRIFPAEDRLTPRSVYIASLVAAAEQIRNGIVSASDMYFFCEETVRAIAESGMKANISRSIVTFDPEADLRADPRFLEAAALYDRYHNAENGRIRIDFSLHAEYTNTQRAAEIFAEEVQKRGARVQLHLSETEAEHAACKARHAGKTPAQFFADCGVFNAPTTAAHCVWAEPQDLSIFREKGVAVVHNPVSNLKLGSGIMPLCDFLDAGVTVALGTDGAASNNALDIRKEMQYAALLAKGTRRDPARPKAEELISLATANGAAAQGREDCGILAEGAKADLALWDLNGIAATPHYEAAPALLYSDCPVCMTVSDGKILYENGNFLTLDVERILFEMQDIVTHYFD